MKKITSEYNMMNMAEMYNKVADTASTREGMDWEKSFIPEGLIFLNFTEPFIQSDIGNSTKDSVAIGEASSY